MALEAEVFITTIWLLWLCILLAEFEVTAGVDVAGLGAMK